MSFPVLRGECCFLLGLLSMVWAVPVPARVAARVAGENPAGQPRRVVVSCSGRVLVCE